MPQVENDPVDLLEEIRSHETRLDQLREQLAGASGDDLVVPALAALEVACRDERLLIPVRAIREVVAMAWPDPLPDAPPWVLGTLNYGGQPVPVLDLDRRLGGRGLGLDPACYLVIIDHPAWLAVVVSQLGRVRTVPRIALAHGAVDVPHAGFILATVTEHGESARLLAPRALSAGVEVGDGR